MPHYICTDDEGSEFKITSFDPEMAAAEAHEAIWSRGGDYPEKVTFDVFDARSGEMIGKYTSEVEMVPSFRANRIEGD